LILPLLNDAASAT